ncbi:MAG TPA: hypothetical protein DDW55_07715 [Gammaproteobacteria bacterium]|nr:hypothetical protein [Gammaproteobacteria bacterium]
MNLRCKMPPVFAGILIGISMLLAFVISGRGIGASGALTRIVAVAQDTILPDLTQKSEYFARYFAHGQNPLDNWLLYLFAGLLLGSFTAALMCRDFKLEVLHGPNISAAGRLLLALTGGILVGFAARLARGCTSGLALVGGAELAVGAWAFMLCVFAGGYATAYFVRKQWI